MHTAWRRMGWALLAGVVLGLGQGPLAAQGQIHEVAYPPGTEEGELSFAVTYRLWVPDGARRIRGIIVHQHGCGRGAGEGGRTAAADLHWQALAAKWDCALLGPSIEQPEGSNCRLWCDPRNGSADRFLQALDDLAEKTQRPEIRDVPWCLWGHSGGAFWSSLMQTMYPERIVAIWFRSGTAYGVWNKGEIPEPELPEAMFGIPMMSNPGAKEEGDPRFGGLWNASVAMFEDYRGRGAPIGFAPGPNSGHDCGTSRYLAIPFFDACLAMRLPPAEAPHAKLRKVDQAEAWLAAFRGERAVPAAEFDGDLKRSVWLPNARVAKAWEQYTASGIVEDTSEPPPVFDAVAERRDDGSVRLAWRATADLESGLAGFLILRGGEPLAQHPEGLAPHKPFQGLSYHDTPQPKHPALEFLDAEPDGSDYEIVAVNTAGLKSPPVSVKPTPGDADRP